MCVYLHTKIPTYLFPKEQLHTVLALPSHLILTVSSKGSASGMISSVGLFLPVAVSVFQSRLGTAELAVNMKVQSGSKKMENIG